MFFSGPLSDGRVGSVPVDRVFVDGPTPTGEDDRKVSWVRGTKDKSGNDCMATEGGAGEGQALAHRLLEALDAGRAPDWDAFHSADSRWLTFVAAGCLARNSRLGSEFGSPEELVNAFLAKKSSASCRSLDRREACCARRVPVASAPGRQFTELLRRCTTIPPPGRCSGGGQHAGHRRVRQKMPLPDYEEVASTIDRQMGAIRSCLPLVQGRRPPSPAPSSPTGLGGGVRRNSIAADRRNREHRADSSPPRGAHSLGCHELQTRLARAR